MWHQGLNLWTRFVSRTFPWDADICNYDKSYLFALGANLAVVRKPCVPRAGGVSLWPKGFFFPKREPKNRQAKKPSTDDKGGPEASAASGAACHREDRLSMQKTFSCPEFRRDFSLSLSFSPMLRLRLLAIGRGPVDASPWAVFLFSPFFFIVDFWGVLGCPFRLVPGWVLWGAPCEEFLMRKDGEGCEYPVKKILHAIMIRIFYS
ncbi:hypothetical protein NPIL_387791 [Nephila pilipes]|uniref:Uncharacterized protein n=1 Tax=Nephila pilipes TaxID=299642 RepID=A0A8X6IWZ1_NEPPI|nr:hypothetical protein NPIL_387791 [Nephila pilipes]